MVPFVSCICPTYGRCPDYQHLLEEAIESFLRQRYPPERRELIVFNDCADQELDWCDLAGVCNLSQAWVREHIQLVNFPARIGTLGEKYNWAIGDYSRGELILPWEDDDISLPGRISQAVEMLGAADYWKPPQVWFLQKGQPPVWQHAVGVRHHASIFRRSAWERVGGYPAVSGAQDAGLDSALRTRCRVAPAGDLGPEEWQYIYRWGVSPVHLSGRAPHDDWYAEVGELPVNAGVFRLRPHWCTEYTRLCRGALCKG